MRVIFSFDSRVYLSAEVSLLKGEPSGELRSPSRHVQEPARCCCLRGLRGALVLLLKDGARAGREGSAPDERFPRAATVALRGARGDGAAPHSPRVHRVARLPHKLRLQKLRQDGRSPATAVNKEVGVGLLGLGGIGIGNAKDIY